MEKEKRKHDGKPVPPELWGRDHLSTLLYVESCAVDANHKPNHAKMRTWSGRPRRGHGKDLPPEVIGGKDYPTRLANGVELYEHDDWDCVDDMVAAGLIEWEGTGTHPILLLTSVGWMVAGMLRRHYSASSLAGKRGVGFRPAMAVRYAKNCADEIPTFSSPTIYRGDTGDELITNGTRIRGYDPRTGELLWHLGPNSEIPIGVPVVTEELIYVTAGYPPIRPIYAIRPGSRGDLAEPEGIDESEALAWSKDRGGTYIPSPLVYRGHFYTNANNGRLTCYDARTGERIYRARIGGVGGSYSASPIAADGRLYFTNEDGETFVVKAGSEYELLAKNSVDGVVLSSPAASNGVLVMRTLNEVYGLAQ